MTRDVALQSSSGRHSPFSQRLAPLGRLRAEMDRWFEDIPARLQQLQAGQIRFPMSSPAIDMTETDDGYQLTAEVPGIDAEDVEISVTDGMLKIAGEKREERAESASDYSYSERSYGRFEREIALPHDADTSAIKARVTKGVLAITMPKDKSAEGRKQQIPVEAG
ncbi:Hsp20/alpha crystallin family protein [Sphingomonas sp. IC-56]|uniref:Hsp20/alpha crystallin family protein n=1 Tax=Sphingomonas sp. IC-56 TaxID=2898529 RepID=UPI001E335292|nr:Hsp20/alpha crystallin family protein [Sphingomonas sp. IC-56]MCD2324416.1 Hsp20/alpha crystallin family protein [Sphingomonas sp. IC-56]